MSFIPQTRAVKGSALSWAEMDGNFTGLAADISDAHTGATGVTGVGTTGVTGAIGNTGPLV